VATIGAQDFKFGLDRRRPRSAGAPGTLWDCQNAHITRGGDIESMRKFEVAYTLPAGTFGLTQAAGQLYTFGSANLAGSVPIGVRYVQCVPEVSANMVRVLHAKAFQSFVYVIAEYDDGMIRHYYNGVRVTDWDSLADGNSTVSTLATYLASKISADSTLSVSASANTVIVSANAPGVPFTIGATAVNVGSLVEVDATATVNITAGTASAGVNQVSQIQAGSLNLLSAPVDWATSNTATATAVAAAISAGGFTATSSGAVIMIKTGGAIGAAGNRVVITPTMAGNVKTTFTNFAGGLSIAINDQTATVATPVLNVSAVREVAAIATVKVIGGSSNPGVNRVSQITAGGVNLMAVPVDWTLSNEATAAAVAASINANATLNGGYTASEAATIITISAPPGQGAFANAILVAVIANGVSTFATNFAGGVSAVTAVSQVSTVTLGGTFETQDLYTITVNGVAYRGTGRASGTGTIAFVYRQRIYSPANTVLQYCALNNAMDWHNTLPASGAGFIDFSQLMDGSERISGLAVYAGYVAIFLPKTTFIYTLSPDATQNLQFQMIPNTGTVAGLSALQFGPDTFYLDSTGVRSLRRADITGTAITNDIGTVLDTFIQSWVNSVGAGVAQTAEAIIEPFDARYWIVIGTRIFVLSLFTTAQVSAWSYYDIGLAFNSLTRIYGKLYARAGNVIYLYGGASRTAYPAANAAPITVSLPFMSAGSPSTFKEWASFDMACSGSWTVTFLVDPDDETAEIQYGTALNTTYAGSLNATVGRTPLVAVRFNCSSGGQATLSSFAASYKSTGDK
jgi:hypothetical protein